MEMILKTLAAAAMLAALTSGQAAAMDLPAPMPEFRSQQELRQQFPPVKTEKADESSRSASKPETFFTGRPADAAGGYLFMFRNFDPELSRWTSIDISGFPDGPNSFKYYPVPTSEIDYLGLATISLSRTVYYSKIYEPNPDAYGTTSALPALISFIAGFLPGSGSLGVSDLIESLTTVGPVSLSDLGNPVSNPNFTLVSSETYTGNWDPFDPAGRTVVSVSTSEPFTTTRYEDFYDPEEGLYPHVISITQVTTTLVVE